MDLGRLRREDKHKKAQEVKGMLLGLFLLPLAFLSFPCF
ncbi:hypothetical protein EMIT079MI2_350004 [Bacillus sp. IT-79MI2]|nr:hypothetical protein BTH41_03268 [Bacillus mycoides]